MKMEMKLNAVLAGGDRDGEKITVAAPHKFLESVQELKLQSGEVIKETKTTYRLVSTGEPLRYEAESSV